MNNFSANYVESNGITIHYYRAPGGRFPVVLLHGITDNGLCWARTADVLAADYDVIALDARGHGLSDKPDTGYSPADHAADVVGVIQALDLDRPALVGHSMGGEVVAIVAASYPALVRGAVLEDPPWRVEDLRPDERAGMAAQWQEWIQGFREVTREQLMNRQRSEAPTWDESELGPWADSKKQVSPDVIKFVPGQHDSWRALLPRITCPVLLVTADVDRGALVPPDVAAVVAEYPHMQAIHLPGAGHNIRREQYDAYIAAVTAFLAGL